MLNISTEKLPIKMWLNEVEESAQEQIKNLANLPFAFHHIAIMPDSHAGYGMPIGGVLATQGVVIPNAVGVDIGCGMCAIRTNLKDISKEEIKVIFGGSKDYHGGIRSCVPVGFDHQSKKQDEELMPPMPIEALEIPESDIVLKKQANTPILNEEYEKARKQLGTLGGGNHFIEIQKGSDGYIWIMLHSGSRNLGYKVANYYNKIAVDLNKKWYSSVPKNWELAFLPLGTHEANSYLLEMQYCVDFAFANRKLMMDRIKGVLEDRNIKFEPMINIAHNYAIMEHHFGKNVMVHRKGATQAREGQIGIIPGSQGTKSYIVKGLGNPESFMSCSHGAGRVMSRKKARENLNLEEEKNKLDEKGIVHSIRNQKDLDEASSAYKNIDEVMENQKDLVEILVELTPLGVIKG